MAEAMSGGDQPAMQGDATVHRILIGEIASIIRDRDDEGGRVVAMLYRDHRIGDLLEIRAAHRARFRRPILAGAATIAGSFVKAEAPENLLLRSEEHTSELQSRGHLVCRLLLEKKNEQRAETMSLMQ